MPALVARMLWGLAALCCAGCAAMITKSEPEVPQFIQVGTTHTQLAQRLGPAIRTGRIEPPRQALALSEIDRQMLLLLPRETALSKAVFDFKGRLDGKARAAQAGFDSFMTLGLAEVYLIPKALWERLTDEELELTVWFDINDRAVAYKWDPLPRR